VIELQHFDSSSNKNTRAPIAMKLRTQKDGCLQTNVVARLTVVQGQKESLFKESWLKMLSLLADKLLQLLEEVAPMLAPSLLLVVEEVVVATPLSPPTSIPSST
jgi:hypothetical protein